MKLKHKILSIVSAMACAASLCAGTITVSSENDSDKLSYGDYLYYKQIDEDEDGKYDYIEITDCNQSATEIEIPEEIDGLPVTSIFPQYISRGTSENLETIVIPKTVKEIGFSYYLESREINIKGDKLKSIIVSPDNPYFSSKDGVLFNKNKTTLLKYPSAKADKSYVIPETVELIESCAFKKCQNLSSIDIGNGVKKIDADAFYGCSAIEQITIPDNVSDIRWGCFIDCISLKSIKLSENITEIGRGTFEGCTSLKSVTIPAKVKKIGMGELPPETGGNYPGAFSSCSSLEEINVDENNENYASENGILFSKNKDVLLLYPAQKNDREYAVPKGVKVIEDAAFKYCSNLETIHFPESLERIGYYVFDGCESLETIEVDKENACYCDIDGVLFSKKGSQLIKYPKGKQNTEYIIPDSVTSIGYAAFGGCTELKSITIPDSVTYIGTDAFSSCKGLKSITIPDSVTSIENSAFQNCSSLTTVTILNPECEICNYEWTICNDAAFDNGTSIVTYSGVIIGYSGSTAQAYAEKWGYNFKLIGEEPTEPIVTTLVTTTVSVATTKPIETMKPAETTKPVETTKPIETTTPIVTTTVPATDEPIVTTTQPIIGDPNDDNVVNVRDCAFIAKALAKNQVNSLPMTADFNDDGKINVRDAAAIASFLAKGGK